MPHCDMDMDMHMDMDMAHGAARAPGSAESDVHQCAVIV